MKQSQLIAAIAVAGLAGTMIGCSRFKSDAQPVPSAQTTAHKPDQCPAPGSYIEAGEDGKPGDRRIEIVEANGSLRIVEYAKVDGHDQQDMDHTFSVKNEEESLGDDALRLAKCSDGSIIVSYLNAITRASTKNVKYESLEGGRQLKVTTTLPIEGSTSSVLFVKKLPNLVGDEGDAQPVVAPAAQAPPAEAPAAEAPAAQAPEAKASAAQAPAVMAPSADPQGDGSEHTPAAPGTHVPVEHPVESGALHPEGASTLPHAN